MIRHDAHGIRYIKSVKLELRDENSKLPQIAVASDKVINSFKILSLDSENELGSSNGLTISGKSKVNKKKQYLDVKLKITAKKEIEEKKVVLYLSFKGIPDKYFCLKETVFIKKLKVGKSKSFDLLNNIILSHKLKYKSLRITII